MTKPITPADYQAFRDFLEEACGIVLGDNKQYLISSRLNRLCQEQGITALGQLMDQVKRDRGLRERIIDAMTTNETYWFRDAYPFDALKQRIFPDLAERGKRQVRSWSAACSSGQEAYSISMMFDEYLKEHPRTPLNDLKILGTDISSSMLDIAREGVYHTTHLNRGLSSERQQRFFTQHGDRWEIKDYIKQRIKFQVMNLMGPYHSLGKFDVIFCRNVLIYFASALKRDILNRLADALEPEGYLLLGASESVGGYCDRFESIRFRGGMIYQLKSTGNR